MILIDTSVLISLFRDKTGETSRLVRTALNGRDFSLARFTQMELLQGAKDSREWDMLSSYLSGQSYLEMDDESWEGAARLYYDLRRKGLTVRSVIDCCIAELALKNDSALLHDDRDFETISTVRRLRQERLPAVRTVTGFHEPDRPPFDLTYPTV